MGTINIYSGNGANKAGLIYNGSGDITVDTEHLANTSSSVQTQLDARLPLAGGTLTGDLIINTSSNGMLKLQEGGNDKGYIGAGGGGLYIKNLAGDVIFRNSSDADTIRIKDSGNVGIGTTSPQAKLHVYNENGGNATDKATMLSEAVLKLQPHTTNSTNLLVAQVNGGNGIGLQVTNGTATANWDIALSPFGGNVGIGEINPAYALDVRGGNSTSNGARIKTGDNGYDGLIVSSSAVLKCYPAAGQSVSLQAYNSGGSTKTGVKVTGFDTPAGEISTKLEFVTEMLGHNVYDNNDYGTSNDQYVDLEDWSPADFRILEIFGTANPNSGGSGAYADPVHMYIYNGTGWNGAEVTYYVYGKSVAPLARDMYNSGSGSSANVAEVWWYNNTTTAQQDAATYGTASGYHLRLKFPNTNTNSTGINLKVIKRA